MAEMRRDKAFYVRLYCDLAQISGTGMRPRADALWTGIRLRRWETYTRGLEIRPLGQLNEPVARAYRPRTRRIFRQPCPYEDRSRAKSPSGCVRRSRPKP